MGMFFLSQGGQTSGAVGRTDGASAAGLRVRRGAITLLGLVAAAALGGTGAKVANDAHERWQAKKQHYQDGGIVAGYDAYRFTSPRGRRSTGRKWDAMVRGIGADWGAVRTVMDVPCGTGRFTRLLLGAGKQVINGDISLAMIQAADRAGREGADATVVDGLLGGVRFDAERIPMPDDAVDMVMSIRFLFHVPRDIRVRIMREFARVSKRWVVVDVRHRYTVTTHTKRLRAWMLGKRTPSERYSLKQIAEDLKAAGLVERSRTWMAPGFSEKMLIVCEKAR
jgi:SAM-dependent methyltransferase